jgi:hypothetical protein
MSKFNTIIPQDAVHKIVEQHLNNELKGCLDKKVRVKVVSISGSHSVEVESGQKAPPLFATFEFVNV